MSLVSQVSALATRIASEMKARVPNGGNVGQVLTKAAGGNAWQDPPSGGPSGALDGGGPASNYLATTQIDGGTP